MVTLRIITGIMATYYRLFVKSVYFIYPDQYYQLIDFFKLNLNKVYCCETGRRLTKISMTFLRRLWKVTKQILRSPPLGIMVTNTSLGELVTAAIC